jgi:integrase
MLVIYLFERGVIPHDLSKVIPSVRIYRKSTIPSVWPSEDLERVIKTIDRNSPIGKRDYVMFLLATRLGIRGCDIRTLKISDIDWDCDEIHFVQSKTQSAITLPLFPELGEAIVDYLRYGRPKSSCNELLLRHNPPFDPFPSNCGLNNIILRCMKRAGVDIPKNRKHGVHSLRHTFASDLLAQGVSFEKIADLLGHNNFDNVFVYLKTQNDALRECSLNLSEVTQIG